MSAIYKGKSTKYIHEVNGGNDFLDYSERLKKLISTFGIGGSRMEEMAMLKTAEKDNEWLQRNFKKIQKEHPNKFVAISKGHVIAESSDSEDVIKEVEKKGKNPATTLIEFIPEKGLVLIL